LHPTKNQVGFSIFGPTPPGEGGPTKGSTENTHNVMNVGLGKKPGRILRRGTDNSRVQAVARNKKNQGHHFPGHFFEAHLDNSRERT
jgi:hypothetical protein